MDENVSSDSGGSKHSEHWVSIERIADMFSVDERRVRNAVKQSKVTFRAFSRKDIEVNVTSFQAYMNHIVKKGEF